VPVARFEYYDELVQGARRPMEAIKGRDLVEHGGAGVACERAARHPVYLCRTSRPSSYPDDERKRSTRGSNSYRQEFA